jgi:Carboxypeptidase regulatory-like domain
VSLVVGASLLVGICAMPASAQVSTGEIFGKATDSTGAVLPGVTVILTSPALIQSQTASTEASGGYRFPNIPIGTYTVTFEIAGFKKLVRESVVITAGFNAEINAKLEISTVQESVTVSGESPVVDTKSTQLGGNFNLKALQDIPTARDPWEIIQQTAGLTMTTENVGGNGSGQQPGFSAHGTDRQLWTMDGATITDTSSNSSPTYYDFDSFEEMTINTGGGDASQQSGGITVNLITKSGSNVFKGSGRFYVTDDKFESQNVTDDLRRQGAGAGNPIQNIKDFGFEVGGPLLRNRAWFWGARSRNDIKVGVIGFLIDPAGDPNDRNNLRTDLTRLDDYNIKLQYQESTGHKSTFFWSRGDKIRNARGVNSTTPIESAFKQRGPTDIYRIQHQWVVNNRLTLDGQFSHTAGGFRLDYQSPDLTDVQRINYVDESRVARSAASNYDTIRPQYETRIDGNYYLPQFLGGDHSLKFGYRYRTTPIESISQYGGGGEVRIRSASNMNTCTVGGVTYTLGCHEANITRDADFYIQRWDSDFFINDNYRFRRLSVNVGLRLDHYDDEAVAASIPANRILPDLLPAIEFPGADSGVVWNNWQPRLGANYDLLGSGKTVVKFSASRYYGITNGTSNVLQAANATTLRYAWRDLNGDLTAQRNELDLSRFLTTPSSNYNQANPSSVTVPVTVDPNLENARTLEFTAGVDHELMRNFAIGATYIHRKYDQFANTFRVGVSSDEYSPVSFTAACGNIVNGTPTCDQASYTGTYFVRGSPLPAAQLRRNTGQYETY